MASAGSAEFWSGFRGAAGVLSASSSTTVSYHLQPVGQPTTQPSVSAGASLTVAPALSRAPVSAPPAATLSAYSAGGPPSAVPPPSAGAAPAAAASRGGPSAAAATQKKHRSGHRNQGEEELPPGVLTEQTVESIREAVHSEADALDFCERHGAVLGGGGAGGGRHTQAIEYATVKAIWYQGYTEHAKAASRLGSKEEWAKELLPEWREGRASLLELAVGRLPRWGQEPWSPCQVAAAVASLLCVPSDLLASADRAAARLSESLGLSAPEAEELAARLVREAAECASHDPHYSPHAKRQRCSEGAEYEYVLQEHLHRIGVPFLSEAVQRERQYSKTVDVLLETPLCVRGRWIRWIDSKAMFCDRAAWAAHRDQLQNYQRMFGTGLVIYWFGHLADLLDGHRSARSDGRADEQFVLEGVMVSAGFPADHEIQTVESVLVGADQDEQPPPELLQEQRL